MPYDYTQKDLLEKNLTTLSKDRNKILSIKGMEFPTPELDNAIDTLSLIIELIECFGAEWMTQRNAEFAGKTPEALIKEGNTSPLEAILFEERFRSQ